MLTTLLWSRACSEHFRFKKEYSKDKKSIIVPLIAAGGRAVI